MLTIFDPKSLGKRWNTSPESVLALIHSGKLPAFTLSPAGSKRPRWKITPDAVSEFESRHRNVTPAKLQRRKQPENVIQFY